MWWWGEAKAKAEANKKTKAEAKDEAKAKALAKAKAKAEAEAKAKAGLKQPKAAAAAKAKAKYLGEQTYSDPITLGEVFRSITCYIYIYISYICIYMCVLFVLVRSNRGSRPRLNKLRANTQIQ